MSAAMNACATGRRRPHEPSLVKLSLGLAAFLAVAAFGLYLAAALGR